MPGNMVGKEAELELSMLATLHEEDLGQVVSICLSPSNHGSLVHLSVP